MYGDGSDSGSSGGLNGSSFSGGSSNNDSPSSNNLGSGLGGFSSYSSNSNDSGGISHLDGSSFAPSAGIVGGEPYSSPVSTYNSGNMNGIQLNDPTGMAQTLSGIVASNNYNGDFSNYLGNTVTSSDQNKEVTSTSLLGSTWNTATQWTDENIVTPVKESYQHWVQDPINSAATALNNAVVTPASQADMAEALGQNNQDTTRSSGFLTESDMLNALQQGETTWTELDKNGLIENTPIGEKYANTIKDMEEIGEKWSQSIQQNRENLARSLEQASVTYDKVNPDSSYYLSTADPRIPRSAYPDQVAKQAKELRDAEGQVVNDAGQYVKDATQVPLTAAFMLRIPGVSQVAGAAVVPMYAYDLAQSYAKNVEQGHNPLAAAGITAYNALLAPAVQKVEEVGTGEYFAKLSERPISTIWDTAMAVEGTRLTGNVLSKTAEGVNRKFDVKVDTQKLDFSQGPDVAIAGGSVLRDAKTDITSESSSFGRILSREEKPANETARLEIDTTGVLTKEAEQSGLKTENGEGVSESAKKHSFDDNINSSAVGKLENAVLDNNWLSNAEYADTLENHVIRGEGIGPKQKGVVGAHNVDHFNRTLEATGFPLEQLKLGDPILHPIIDGVSAQYYTVPGYVRGEFSGFKNIRDPKTLYDPAKISDSEIIQLGKEAMKNGIIQPNGRMVDGTASNGLDFRGYIENGEITNFHPKLPIGISQKK